MKKSIFLTIKQQDGLVIDEKLFNDDEKKSSLKKVFEYLDIQSVASGLIVELSFTHYQG